MKKLIWKLILLLQIIGLLLAALIGVPAIYGVLFEGLSIDILHIGFFFLLILTLIVLPAGIAKLIQTSLREIRGND